MGSPAPLPCCLLPCHCSLNLYSGLLFLPLQESQGLNILLLSAWLLPDLKKMGELNVTLLEQGKFLNHIIRNQNSEKKPEFVLWQLLNDKMVIIEAGSGQVCYLIREPAVCSWCWLVIWSLPSLVFTHQDFSLFYSLDFSPRRGLVNFHPAGQTLGMQFFICFLFSTSQCTHFLSNTFFKIPCRMVITIIGQSLSIFLTKAEVSMDIQNLSCKVQKHSSNYLKKELFGSHYTPWKIWDLTP